MRGAFGDHASAQKLITDGAVWTIGVLRTEGFDATGGDDGDQDSSCQNDEWESVGNPHVDRIGPLSETLN